MTKEQKDRDEKVAWKQQISSLLTKLGFVQQLPKTDASQILSCAALHHAIENRNPMLEWAEFWYKGRDYVYYGIPAAFAERPYIKQSTIPIEELLTKDGRS